MTGKDQQLRFTVTEVTAKAFRLWEELGGPDKLHLDDARAILDQMTDVEQREVPTWPRQDDAKLKVYYQVPKKYRLRGYFRGN